MLEKSIDESLVQNVRPQPTDRMDEAETYRRYSRKAVDSRMYFSLLSQWQQPQVPWITIPWKPTT